MSLAQGNNTPTRPRIEPGSPDPESEGLTTRPVRPNLCCKAKIRKQNVYPSKPQFYYIKVGCKGVQITRTCFPDGHYLSVWSLVCL